MADCSLLLFILMLIYSDAARALEFSVVGPCDPSPLLQISVESQTSTLGDLTIEVLTSAGIPFRGSRSGLRTIANSPEGDKALEILSDTQMRAYGWCVSIDGQQPDRMPDEVQLTGKELEITWFYAFALYERGEWKSFCTPSYQVKSPFICAH